MVYFKIQLMVIMFGLTCGFPLSRAHGTEGAEKLGTPTGIDISKTPTLKEIVLDESSFKPGSHKKKSSTNFLSKKTTEESEITNNESDEENVVETASETSDFLFGEMEIEKETEKETK